MFNPVPRSPESLVPFSQLRQRIAERLEWSWKNIPHFWVETEAVDMTCILDLKEKFSKTGKKIRLDCFFLWALRCCILQTPVVNSCCFVRDIELRPGQKIPWFHREDSVEINVGISLNVTLRSGEEGLVVPVLRGLEHMSFAETAAALNEIVERVHSGKMVPQDFEGGTITLSNAGAISPGNGYSIINPPQSTIVTFGRLHKGAIVNEKDEVTVRPVLKITLGCDHRVYDGKTAGKFLGELKDFLEHFPSDVSW